MSDVNDPEQLQVTFPSEQALDRVDAAARADGFDDVNDFVLEATLRLVDELVDENGPFPCPHDDCDKGPFATRRQQRGHLGSDYHADFPEGEFWCGYCGFGPTSWRGVNAHHGSSDHDGEPIYLDEEPDAGDLLAPDDVPDHRNEALLEQLYKEYDGSYTKMCRNHDFEVGPGRVRHYLIEFGIHDVTPQDQSGPAPMYRDPEWLKKRYRDADKNVSEMHRRLEREGEDIPYRTLLKNLKKFGIHDPTDPPGKRHGKGGPKTDTEPDGIFEEHLEDDDVDDAVSTGEARGSDAENTPADPSSSPDSDESMMPGDYDIPEDRRAYHLEWGRWGAPQGGTYHAIEDCSHLRRSDSDRETWVLPWPIDELQEDDDWEVCGTCSGRAVESNQGDTLLEDGEDDNEEEPEPAPEPTGPWPALSPEDVDGFEDLPLPDWLDEMSFYQALDMAEDVDGLVDVLGWDEPERLERAVELLGEGDRLAATLGGGRDG